MRFSEFDSSKDGSSKIIYEGKFTKDKTKQILNLRVWISDEYDYDDTYDMSSSGIIDFFNKYKTIIIVISIFFIK